MKFDGKIDLFIGEDGLRIEIYCDSSGQTLFKGKVSANNTCAALGRLSRVPLEEANFYNGDKVGKVMLMDKLTFEMPEHRGGREMADIAKEIAVEKCPYGWKADLYFKYQGSFTYENGITFAHTTIRKWVEKEDIHVKELQK